MKLAGKLRWDPIQNADWQVGGSHVAPSLCLPRSAGHRVPAGMVKWHIVVNVPTEHCAGGFASLDLLPTSFARPYTMGMVICMSCLGALARAHNVLRAVRSKVNTPPLCALAACISAYGGRPSARPTGSLTQAPFLMVPSVFA